MRIARHPHLAAGLVLVAFTATACAASGGTAAVPTFRASRTPAAPASNPTSPPSPPTPAPRPADVPVPFAAGSGSRPQTPEHPRTRGLAFHAMVTDLWLAVRTGEPGLGRDAFFPVDAYKQVKAISDPAADWRTRLWDDFVLDVKAAHHLLGRDARKARLVKVLVAGDQAAWIGPGGCYNSIGYWHVANSRVVYRAGGHERSFGIASLISWRGAWYVVHFGGVVRPAVGMVDTPTSGQGTVGPQGGC